MAQAEEHAGIGVGRYLIIYLCILALAGVQFVIAYQNIDIWQKIGRMFFVALAEAGLAVMFFMHLWSERRGFLLTVAIIAIFVFLGLQYSWPDSFRMSFGVPGARIPQ